MPDNGKFVITQEGFEKLQAELAQLKGPKRQEIIRAIAHARELGDLRENAEYDSARHAQALLEDRIKDLEDKLARAAILSAHDIPEGKVSLGTAVTLKNLGNGEELCYTLVGQEEANLELMRISITTPIAKALIGKQVGDEVTVVIPAGTKKFKILGIKIAF